MGGLWGLATFVLIAGFGNQYGMNWTFAIQLGVGSALVLGLMFGLVPLEYSDPFSGSLGKNKKNTDKLPERDVINTVDRLKWNWKRAIISMLLSLLTALIVIGIRWLGGQEQYNDWSSLMKDWIPLGLVLGIWLASMIGFSPGNMEKTIYPEQKIRATRYNSFLMFIVVLVSFGVGIGLLMGAMTNISAGFYVAISAGIIAGSGSWLIFGGLSLTQHYVLRTVIARENNLPFRLVPFLDHCVDLIFLRRVGGGYIFVHRLLMEHFAEMDEETINRLAAG